MTDYLSLARRAPTPDLRAHFTRLARQENLKTRIRKCRDCPLWRGHRSVPGSGPIPSPIAFVGEGPGYDEDKRGEPFVGRAGRMLNQILTSVGMPRESVYVTNLVRHRPPENRAPTTNEISACSHFLEEELGLVNAWLVVLLGSTAYQAISGDDKGISSVRGKAFWKKGRVYLPTYHPAYILRNRDALYTITNDIETARDILRGDQDLPSVAAKIHSPYESDGALIKVDPTQQIRKKGWVLIYSAVLDDQVVIVRDNSVKPPSAIASLPAYTVGELLQIGLLGRQRALRLADLQAIHQVKTILKGEVVGTLMS